MAAKKGEDFKPGEICKQSGIYKVFHDQAHRPPHEVTAVNGKRFPPCSYCKNAARFILVHAARQLNEHPDFD
jgi:hypothetical protein